MNRGTVFPRAGLLALCGLGVSLLMGCGGGEGFRVPVNGPAAPVARLLAPQEGQSWSYQAKVKTVVGGVTSTASGTRVIRIEKSQGLGLGLVDAISGSDDDPTTHGILNDSETYYLQVDSLGNENVNALQEGTASAHPVAGTYMLAPGTFEPKLDISGVVNFPDFPAPLAWQFKIVGAEWVTVPAGTFYTWKVTVTTTDYVTGAPITRIDTRWYAPEIGNFVRQEETRTNASDPGYSWTETDVLTSTNIPHG